MQNKKTIPLCALFCALMAIGALVKIPTPFLPMTLQTFFAVLCGLLLDKKSALSSMCIYILLGLLGFPVFSMGGGIGYIAKPTFGFILGFSVLAYYVSRTTESLSGYFPILFRTWVGLLLLYIVGIFYYIFVAKVILVLPVSVHQIFLYCFLLPLPSDILSCFLATAVACRLKRILKFHV